MDQILTMILFFLDYNQTMEAETKSGKIIIENGEIRLVREGIVGTLASVSELILSPITLIFGTNRDKVIQIAKIQKVEYTQGVNQITRPHLRIFYDKPKPRLVIFKKPIVDLLNREKALGEMEKVIAELKKLGVTVVEV